MKTYTITCHNVYNYGASLQAFALQKFLLSRGIDNKIIDYMPEYLSWHYHFRWWISPRGSHYGLLKKCAPLRFCYVFRRYLRDVMSLKRKRAFDTFLESNMVLTKRCTTVDEINKCVANADILIAGSDQIWNSYSLENGLDSAFYLDFGPCDAKRISYAASFGVNIVKENTRKFVVEKLHRFNKLSIREEKGQHLLESLGFASTVVSDPVFLLEPAEWGKIQGSKHIEGQYVLLYAIGSASKEMMKMASQIEKETGCKLISIRSNNPIDKVSEVKDAGPAEFVDLIKNATYVLSNSFHATAFSLIFQKHFYSFSYGSHKTSERIVNLLHSVGLDDRYNPDEFDKTKIIEYSMVNFKLDAIRSTSTDWLDNVICCYK